MAFKMSLGLPAVTRRHRMRSPTGAHPATPLTPVILATYVPVAVGSDNGARGRPHCGAASTSDRTPNDRTSYSASSCAALRHDISYRRGKTQHQQK